MAHVDGGDYVLSEIYYSILCKTLVNTLRKHDVDLTLAHRCDAGPASNQHWFNASCLLGAVLNPVFDVGPTLYKCFTNVLCLLGIAACLALLNTAGDDYKLTPTQCLLNVGPATPVLASIHSVLVSTSC